VSTHEQDEQPDLAPFAALSPDWILAAVESTGQLCDGRMLALNSYENRVYQVGLEEGTPLVAKFYRPQRWTRAQILEEQQFVLELNAAELPVVAPLIAPTGEFLHEYEGFLFALYPRCGGRSPDLSLEHLHQLGRCLGQLHNIGGRTDFQHRHELSIERFGDASARFLLEHGFIPADLRTAYQSLTRDLLLRIRHVFSTVDDIPYLRLHGDFHASNVLWRDDKPLLVDFDDCMQGPAVQDLWMLLSGERMQQQAQLGELIDGYEMFCEFDRSELVLIEALRSLRLLHYSAWLARRWHDPAFPRSFPWFNTARYWAGHILELREQLAALQEPPLQVF
jgi:Ser/Thr protein kinase RdoA (MazF antagonist)